jgi:hypothetical protein
MLTFGVAHADASLWPPNDGVCARSWGVTFSLSAWPRRVHDGGVMDPSGSPYAPSCDVTAVWCTADLSRGTVSRADWADDRVGSRRVADATAETTNRRLIWAANKDYYATVFEVIRAAVVLLERAQDAAKNSGLAAQRAKDGCLQNWELLQSQSLRGKSS